MARTPEEEYRAAMHTLHAISDSGAKAVRELADAIRRLTDETGGNDEREDQSA